MRLDVYEEVSNVVHGTTNQNTNPLGPTTTIRSASTTVMVQDHRTAVIGGLLSNENDIQRSAIPFISDIPVIGNLFSDNGSDKKKHNLLVFLTPHVIRTRDDLRSLALDERQKFTDSLGRREITSDADGAVQAALSADLQHPGFAGAGSERPRCHDGADFRRRE